MNLCKY